MKCPYCDGEMSLGYLQSSRTLVWDTEQLSGSILPSSESGLELTKRMRWNKAHAIKAYRCKKCDILISSLNDSEKR